jgi:hypothetical protein
MRGEEGDTPRPREEEDSKESSLDAGVRGNGHQATVAWDGSFPGCREFKVGKEFTSSLDGSGYFTGGARVVARRLEQWDNVVEVWALLKGVVKPWGCQAGRG